MHDQMTARGKCGSKNLIELHSKGLVQFASFKTITSIVEISLVKNFELFMRAAQFVKIYAPYFFKSH